MAQASDFHDYSVKLLDSKNLVSIINAEQIPLQALHKRHLNKVNLDVLIEIRLSDVGLLPLNTRMLSCMGRNRRSKS